MKEKVNCPDCGKELTVHGLKYTHKRYCKAKPQPGLDEPISKQQPMPIQKLSEPMYVENNTTYDQIAAYLLNQKKTRASNIRQHVSALVSNALPK